MDRLEEIRARWAKATPGPWLTDEYRTGVFVKQRGLQYNRYYEHPLANTLMMGLKQGTPAANAEAIAAVPEDIAWLAGEVSRLRAALAVYADEDNWEDCIWNGELGGPDVARRELAGKEARDG